MVQKQSEYVGIVPNSVTANFGVDLKVGSVTVALLQLPQYNTKEWENFGDNFQDFGDTWENAKIIVPLHKQCTDTIL